MQLTLQSTNLGLGFLRARILPLSAIVMLGDGYIPQSGLPSLHVGTRLDTHKLTEALHLIKNHPLHLSNIIDDLEMKVEGCWADRFIRRIVPDMQVTVFEGLLDGDALRRVEGKHFVQQVQRVWVRVAEERLEGDFLHVWQVTHVLLCAR